MKDIPQTKLASLFRSSERELPIEGKANRCCSQTCSAQILSRSRDRRKRTSKIVAPAHVIPGTFPTQPNIHRWMFGKQTREKTHLQRRRVLSQPTVNQPLADLNRLRCQFRPRQVACLESFVEAGFGKKKEGEEGAKGRWEGVDDLDWDDAARNEDQTR